MESDTIDCSVFNPAWTFNDDFVDFFEGRGQVWLDDAGQPIRAIEHIVHRSNDVNSVTGFTLHEHNHFVAQLDFVRGTVTLNGAINIMQRPGAGSVILNAGHKVFDLTPEHRSSWPDPTAPTTKTSAAPWRRNDCYRPASSAVRQVALWWR